MTRCSRPSTISSGPSAPTSTGAGCTRRAAEKIVYSRTLQTPSSARTRIERDFDPAAIRQLKEASARDITIGGAELACRALALGLVDECQLFLGPLIVGGGKRALPEGIQVRLELLEQRRFGSGVVHLRYRVRG